MVAHRRTLQLRASRAAYLAVSRSVFVQARWPNDLLAGVSHGADLSDIEKPPVRFSHLKEFAKSPAHYRSAIDNDSIGISDRSVHFSRSIAIGSIVHSLVLGGPEAVPYTGKVRRGKQWDDFKKENEGALICTPTELETARTMSDAIRGNPQAQDLLAGSRYEFEVNWSYLGRACQSHIDILGDTHVTEIKTCRSARPEDFQWAALRFHYLAQLAFYREAVRGFCNRHSPRDCFIIAVENTRPFAVTVMRLSNASIEKGAQQIRAWFEKLLVCEETNCWPAYTQTIQTLEPAGEAEELIFEDDQ